jgi:hypothetical protein
MKSLNKILVLILLTTAIKFVQVIAALCSLSVIFLFIAGGGTSPIPVPLNMTTLLVTFIGLLAIVIEWAYLFTKNVIEG